MPRVEASSTLNQTRSGSESTKYTPLLQSDFSLDGRILLPNYCVRLFLISSFCQHTTLGLRWHYWHSRKLQTLSFWFIMEPLRPTAVLYNHLIRLLVFNFQFINFDHVTAAPSLTGQHQYLLIHGGCSLQQGFKFSSFSSIACG